MGDLLYAKSFELTTAHGDIAIQRVIATATSRMCQGELHQLESDKNFDLTEMEYLQVISNKTACLMAACTQSGGMIGGASTEELDIIWNYGLNLGMAFQIMDDVLDYIASPDEIGKSVQNDAIRGKITLPLIHYLQHSKDPGPVMAYLNGENSKVKIDLRMEVESTESIEYARAVATRYTSDAKDRLAHLRGERLDSSKIDHLKRLADFVIYRGY